jgi:hypothetical protein
MNYKAELAISAAVTDIQVSAMYTGTQRTHFGMQIRALSVPS